jgi:hypothetical protein
MPKRIVDGEALWRSSRVKKLPEELRLHFANWIPLAEANGAFEADAGAIWSRVYAYWLPTFTEDDVENLLHEFEKVGLVEVYEGRGKRWAKFYAIEKAGRLPCDAHKERYADLPPLPGEAGILPESQGDAGIIRETPGDAGNRPQGFGLVWNGLVRNGLETTDQPDEESQDENVRNTPQTSDSEQGTLSEGDPGYYAEGQYSYATTPDKVFRVMKEKWQAMVGKGNVCNKPFGRTWDWFNQALTASDPDVLIPAFELWAFEQGRHSPKPYPIGDFLHANWESWVKRVGPSNEIDKPRVFELTPEQVEAERLRIVAEDGDLDLNYYEGKLADKRAMMEEMGRLLTEPDREVLEDEIRELEEKVEEFKAKETQQ